MRPFRILLYVKDLRRMADFYGSVLAAAPSHTSDEYVEFDSDGLRLALHAVPAAIAEHIRIATPPETRENTPVRLSFLAHDLETEASRLRALGVKLEHRPWNALLAIDPEGNVFEITLS
jgi:extradiol dioxygenase family protein